MNWIIYSAIMFFSSVALYLLIRKTTLMKVPTALNNIAMFVIPLFIYFIISFIAKVDLSINLYQFIIILLISIFCSYLGNVLSLKSIKYAPNPGFSLVIQKSYVVFTTIVAVFAFHSHLTFRTLSAIIIIVSFSALIMIEKEGSQRRRNTLIWLSYAVGAFFCFGMLTIMTKYLFTIGVNVFARLIYLSTIVSIIILGEIRLKKTQWRKISWSTRMLLLGIGIFSASFNGFMNMALQVAPNVGYVNAINAASISLLTVCAAIIFKDEFSIKKFIGVIGVTLGLFMLVF